MIKIKSYRATTDTFPPKKYLCAKLQLKLLLSDNKKVLSFRGAFSPELPPGVLPLDPAECYTASPLTEIMDPLLARWLARTAP